MKNILQGVGGRKLHLIVLMNHSFPWTRENSDWEPKLLVLALLHSWSTGNKGKRPVQFLNHFLGNGCEECSSPSAEGEKKSHWWCFASSPPSPLLGSVSDQERLRQYLQTTAKTLKNSCTHHRFEGLPTGSRNGFLLGTEPGCCFFSNRDILNNLGEFLGFLGGGLFLRYFSPIFECTLME